MKKIQLFPMTIEDYDDVRILWGAIQGFRVREIDDSIEKISLFLEKNPFMSVVAKDGDMIVGTILCGNDGRQGTFYHVCVDKKYRRLGIASAMMEYCLKKLGEIGINKVSLIAFSNNHLGNSFWKKKGWQQVQANYYEYVLNEKNVTTFIEK